MEQQYGSVIRATLADRKQKSAPGDTSGSGARYGLFATHENGLADMTSAVAESLRASERVDFRMKSNVAEVKNTGHNSSQPQWDVQLDDQSHHTFDAVIITLPTHAAAAILPDDSFRELTSALNSIQYASSAIVVSGHRLQDFNHPLDAFGLVIPAIEQRKILAVSFSSRKFPGRAPEGHVLLRTFVGGAMQPELLERDDDEMVQLVNDELTSILGMKSEPLFSEVVRYNNAMPQYHVGHLDRVAAIESHTRSHPGLALAGSAYHGVGIPDSIASGFAAADAVCRTQ
jgi:oxygen-dependent protoporphyrinogen oxidase